MLSSLQNWQVQYNLRQHKQRLKEIKHEKANGSWAEDLKRKPRASKRKSLAEREVVKENELIIKKLQQQSSRRPEFTQQTSDWPKTLNAPHRHQEARRIALENERFAKRIQDKPSVISIRHLESDFKRNRQYVRIRSKSNVAKACTKLPALKRAGLDENEEPIQAEPLQYSTNFKLMSITPLPELGMDGPVNEIVETSEEHWVETE